MPEPGSAWTPHGRHLYEEEHVEDAGPHGDTDAHEEPVLHEGRGGATGTLGLKPNDAVVVVVVVV